MSRRKRKRLGRQRLEHITARYGDEIYNECDAIDNMLESLLNNMPHKYLLLVWAYWADREDSAYAPIVVSFESLSDLLAHIVECDFAAQKRFSDNFHKPPMIVGHLILKRSTPNESRASFGAFLLALGRHCLLNDKVGCWFVHDSSLPRMTVLSEGLNSAERALVLREWGPRIVEEEIDTDEIGKRLGL